LDCTNHVEAFAAMRPQLGRIENQTVKNVLWIWDVLHIGQPWQAEANRSVRVPRSGSYRLFVEEQPRLCHSHRNEGNCRRNNSVLLCETDGFLNLVLSVLPRSSLSIAVYKEHVTWVQINRSLDSLL